MSESMEVLAGQVDWGAKNLAFNLDFIPDDKLSWKPAPTANSALGIVGHMVMAYTGIGASIKSALAGEKVEMGSHDAPTFSTRDEAKTALLAAAQNFAQVVRTIPADRLGEKVDIGFGIFPLSFIAGMGAIDTIHHHGQIAYIQMLLGDEESHFDMSLFG